MMTQPQHPCLLFRTVFFLLALQFANTALACSACKVTVSGKTYFGNNEDNWRLGSQLWFEPAKEGTPLGAAFFGYGDKRPQGGMNEAGLAFDVLTIHAKQLENKENKPLVGDWAEFNRKILTTCSTVEEVAALANHYHREGMSRGVFFFVDKAGHYLVMEPDTLLIGQNASYILANYCPSSTPESERMAFARYAKGRAFLDSHPLQGDGASYCQRLVDTMHVCRPKIGDGTLHSYIADLNARTIQLFFYHDYSQSKMFDLKAELQKGEHSYDIASLFPNNAEYAQLLRYQTARNNKALFLFIAASFVFFCFTALLNLIKLLRKKATNKPLSVAMLIASLISLPLLVKLLIDPAVYYFPFPYNGYGNLLNYVPIAIVIMTGFGIYYLIKNKVLISNILNASALALNTVFIGLFVYWGLFPF